MTLHQPHRGKLELIQQILSFIDKRIDIHNTGTYRQQILNGVGINHIQLKKYLTFLVENGLLIESQAPIYFRANSYVYRITPKGILFLKLFKELHTDEYDGRKVLLA